MQNKIVALGLTLPGEDIETLTFRSDRSLLDADIILVEPQVPHGSYDRDYQGKPWLEDSAAFETKEAFAHWRREILAALQAGKLVVVFVRKPYDVFIDTGEQRTSGTGRNARITKIVQPLTSYDLLPLGLGISAASGVGIRPAKDLKYLALYWKEFWPSSPYQAYFEGSVTEKLLLTKDGDRLVGAAIRSKSGGMVLLVPPINLSLAGCVEKGENGRLSWTKKADAFGKRLVATLAATAQAIRAEASITPPPEWTGQTQYRLDAEATLERQIADATKQIEKVQKQKLELEVRRKEAMGPRRLLFESGKQLETAILAALQTLGFDAQPFADGESEFDAVFVSAEGRFLGEAEGKDNKAVNIDKITQLERNLQEDFARDGVEDFAKGVLFGNAHRLQRPESRGEFFTEKCLKAATRLGVALIRTPDLFNPVKYLLKNKDEDYARMCRTVILEASGVIVVFPSPPSQPDSAPTEPSVGAERGADAAQQADD